MIFLLDIIALVVLFMYSGVLLIDEVEHLHASYFISAGALPYRDFFEHHHPLFLFLLTPLVALLPQNAILVLYVSRLLMSLFSVGAFYYLYKLAKDFLGDKTYALISILIFLSFYPTLYMFSVIKPDTLMNFFFACGLYYFFSYIKTLKAKPLIIASASLTLSFLFLQTAAFMIAPIVIIALYVLYKNPAQFKNFLYATILPISFVGAFILYLYETESLKEYFQLCWIFNSAFFSLLNFRLPSILPDFMIYILLGYIAYGYLIFSKRSGFFVHALAFLLSFALLKNIIYPSYYPRYLLPCFLYTSFLIAATIKYAPIMVHNYLKAALLFILVINMTITFALYNNRSSLKVLNLIKPEDSCLNFYANEQNIYQPLVSYYWYAPSISSVDDYLFNRTPEYDITKLAEEQKFKYILYNRTAYKQKVPIPQESADEKFKQTYKRHTIEDDVFKDYDFIGIDNIGIYKRKD